MLFLSNTSSSVRVVTTNATPIRIHASWMDNSAGALNPGSENYSIAAAASTIIVPAPTAGFVRNVRNLVIANNHASLSAPLDVLQTDGTDEVPHWSGILAPRERIIRDGEGRWMRVNAAGTPVQEGPPGAAATIAAGTATALAATAPPTVTNSGTGSAAVFDFGIPAGFSDPVLSFYLGLSYD
jgi:hypothetical protein